MGNPYPIEIQAGDDQGPVVFVGEATFTDSGNQPGGGSVPVVVTFPIGLNASPDPTPVTGVVLAQSTDPESGAVVFSGYLAGASVVAEGLIDGDGNFTDGNAWYIGPGDGPVLYAYSSGTVGAGVQFTSNIAASKGVAANASDSGVVYQCYAFGATAALDCAALPITGLATADPHIAGALWNNAGTPAISAG